MTVFTDARVDSMRSQLAELLEKNNAAQNAHFSATFTADDEVLVITVGDRRGDVSVLSAGDSQQAEQDADFGFTGKASDWERYFAERPVSHASLITMAMASEVSSGQIPSVVTPSGSLERLFGNLPIYNSVLEAAIAPKAATR